MSSHHYYAPLSWGPKHSPGLTNQLYVFTHAILKGFTQGYRLFAVEKFLCCIHSRELALASAVLDLPLTSAKMSQVLGAQVQLLDLTPALAGYKRGDAEMAPPEEEERRKVFIELLRCITFAPKLLAAVEELML